jgi:asparagine synthase (glutamine-hydrolysing)
MEGILPEDIQWRGDKSNLSPNFVQGLLDRDQERVEAVVHGKVSSLTQYVDVAALQQLYERVAQEREGNDAANLFRAVVLAVWLDHHVS